MSALDPADEPATLVGLLDGLLDRGVHVAGDLSIGLADVELIRVALRVLVASEETAQRTGRGGDGVRPADRPSGQPTSTSGPEAGRRPAGETGPGSTAVPTRAGVAGAGSTVGRTRAEVTDADREQLTRGIAQLVLTVVEVVRELLERQAIRRVEAGSLDDEQVERLGVALEALEERMAEVKDVFGVTDEDLNLDLGPLGRLR